MYIFLMILQNMNLKKRPTEVRARNNTSSHIRISFSAGFVLLLCMTMSCSPWRRQASLPFPEAQSQEEQMVLIALEDFLTIRNLVKQDSFFYISFKDSVFHKGYMDKTSMSWRRGPLYPGVKCVEIIGDNECRYSPDWEAAFPSHYYLRRGKLFLWRDKTTRATKEVIDLLYQKGIIDPTLDWLEFSEDDSKKAAFYYFRSDGSYQYKRIITNEGIIEPPKGL